MKVRALELYERFQFNVLGPYYRSLGLKMFKWGCRLQKELCNQDRLVPSLRFRSYKDDSPELEKCNFIAPNSVIIGKVSAQSSSSIWYGATLRGDLGSIKIGKQSIIQDLATLKPQSSIVIEDEVVISSKAYLSDCTIKSRAFIGLGATINSNCFIESYGVLAAGAVLEPNSRIKEGEVWAGNPARKVRNISVQEREAIDDYQQELVQLAVVHQDTNGMTFREYLNENDYQTTFELVPKGKQIEQFLIDMNIPANVEDREHIEQRVFMQQKSDRASSVFWRRDFDNYEQDMFNYPDNFKIYGENYNEYQRIERYFQQNPVQDQKYIERDTVQIPQGYVTEHTQQKYKQ